MVKVLRSGLMQNLISVVAGEAAARVAGLIAAVFVARYLGPLQLGALALAQSLVTLASAASDGGLTIWGVRAIAREPQGASAVVRSVLILQTLLAGVIGLILWLVSLTLVTSTSGLLVISIPYLLVQALNLQYVLQARERFPAVAVARAIGQMTTAIISSVGVVATREPEVVALAFWLGPLLTDLLIVRSMWRWRSVPNRTPNSPTRHPLLRTLRSGLPFLTTSVIGQYVLSIGPITIGIVLDTRAVGDYSAAFRVVTLVFISMSLVVSAIYPEILRRHRDENQFPEFVRLVSTMAVKVALSVAALLLFIAPDLVHVLFGRQFARSGAILQVMCLSIPIVCHNAIASRGLMAAGLEGRVASCVANSALFATVAYPTATLLFGTRGCAFAFAAVLGVQALLMRHDLRSVGLQALPAWQTLPCFAAPAAVLLAWNLLFGDTGGIGDLGVWLTAVILLELFTGRSTLQLGRQLLQIEKTSLG